MSNIVYEETEGVIAPGSNVLLYSDGIVEAHDRESRMFGFPRLREALTIDDKGAELLDRLLDTLHAFTGANWEQEDDITLVTLRRAAAVAELAGLGGTVGNTRDDADTGAGGDAGGATTASQVITAFSVPGEEGNERLAMDRVRAALSGLGLEPPRLERLITAVSETTMNAIEYGSQGRADIPVDVVVETTPGAVVVRITDRALSGGVPADPEAPDMERKLAGDQKPRGWGLFLIKNMVDSMDVTSDGSTQTVSLTLAREERTDG